MESRGKRGQCVRRKLRAQVNLLLHSALFDLVQLHVKARPEFLELELFSSAFPVKPVTATH